MSTGMKCEIASCLGPILLLAGFETLQLTVPWQQVWMQFLAHRDTQAHGILVLQSQADTLLQLNSCQPSPHRLQ